MHDCMKGQSDVVLLLSKPAKTSNLVSRLKTWLLFADAIALHCNLSNPISIVINSILQSSTVVPNALWFVV